MDECESQGFCGDAGGAAGGCGDDDAGREGQTGSRGGWAGGGCGTGPMKELTSGVFKPQPGKGNGGRA